MARVEREDKYGVVKMYPHEPKDFAAIDEVTIPDGKVYLLLDIDRGKESINMPPKEALNAIRDRKRSPLINASNLASASLCRILSLWGRARSYELRRRTGMLTLETEIATIVVPGTACVIVPYFLLRATGASLTPPFGVIQFVSVLVVILGLVMVLWVSTAFVRIGRGTPFPIHPPARFVATGLYRYVRNPIYVGALLILLAEAAYFGSIWILVYAAGLWVIFQVFLVVFEEPQLRRRFGADYETYLKTVPRWIPRLWKAPEEL